MTVQFKNSIGESGARSIQSIVENSRRNAGAAFGLYRRYGKRAFDLFFVLATAPVAVVMVALAAALTALDGHNPFYRQKRVGRNGREFWMWKIRTMVPDADAYLATYLAANPAAAREWEEKQKLENDPRITWLGALLRKTSLDELPQLWNVLMGEMSIVGPRPMMVDQKPLYPGQTYYQLRPGITGNWQVSDRSVGSFAGRAGFDDAYGKNLSFATDMDILARTAGAVLRCTGR